MTTSHRASAISLKYTILDVFTETRYTGNPLAIVELPNDNTVLVTQEQKQTIAKEFNLSETVFLHPARADQVTLTSDDTSPSLLYPIDIFTPIAEIPFAGHPTIGSGVFLLSKSNNSVVVLQTKAGRVPVSAAGSESGGNVARLQVPADLRIHNDHGTTAFNFQEIKQSQTRLVPKKDFVNGMNGKEPVVSLVKGVNYVLLEVTSEEALGRMEVIPASVDPFQRRISSTNTGEKEMEEEEWRQGFLGIYAFYQRPEDGVIRTRMFSEEGVEDPATGSAAATLGGFLALTKKTEATSWAIDMVQGVEMGRKSEIRVTVSTSEDKTRIGQIELQGAAVEVMRGELLL